MDGGLEIWHIIWYGGIGLEMEGAIPFTNCDKCNLQAEIVLFPDQEKCPKQVDALCIGYCIVYTPSQIQGKGGSEIFKNFSREMKMQCNF